MRMEMTSNRIGNWACPYCGARIKKKVILKNQTGAEIGYSLVCCNCGHVENFAADEEGISVFVAGDNVSVKRLIMGCAKGTTIECELAPHCPLNLSNIDSKEKPEKPNPVPSPFDGLSKIYD